MSTAVTVENITKRFGLFKALDRVSFEVPEQTLFGLLGPNGAGKTTLFSIIAGYLRPNEGKVSILGKDFRQVSDLQGRFSVLPQDALFQNNIPILEQLVFFSLLSGRTKKEAEKECREALELVGLSESIDRSAQMLSHGMSKRLGIAQAFLGQPEVIFLDEPTAGLDPANARNIRDLIQKLKQRATVVISSHDLKEIQEICSHVAILNRGQVVASGPVDEIVSEQRLMDVRFATPLTPPQLAVFASVPGIKKMDQKDPCEYILHVAGGMADVDQTMMEFMKAAVAQHVYIRKLNPGASLENFFLEVTKK